MSGDVMISGRDFGRLEGKVDGIAADVGELKGWVRGVDKRVTTLEQGEAITDAAHKSRHELCEENRQAEGFTEQKNEAVQMTRQTVLMMGALVIASVSMIVALFAYFHL